MKLLQILVNHRLPAGLGPIVVVCYTNHALDQMLVALLDAGVKKIVRVGQRSQEKRLASLNLDEFVGEDKQEDLDPVLRRLLRTRVQELNKCGLALPFLLRSKATCERCRPTLHGACVRPGAGG